MVRGIVAWMLVPLALATAACEREPGGEEPGDPDTLAIDIPDGGEVEDRLEEGARRIGGRVGEALEETGEAIEQAGERLREESAEPDTPGDTL